MAICEQRRTVRYGHERLGGIDLYALPCRLCGALPGGRHGKRCPLGLGAPHLRPRTCLDCGTVIGNRHRPGCCAAVCRDCGYELLACDCYR